MYRILLILSLILVHGCTSTQANKQDEQAGQTVGFTHLKLSKPPANLVGQHLQVLVNSRQGAIQYETLMQVQMGIDNIAMIGKSRDGAQLFEMQWFESQPYRLTKSPLAKEIDIKNLLADLQLIYWPKAQLSQYIVGAQIVDEDNTRTIFRAGKPIVLIERVADTIALEHLEQRYRLTIRAVPNDPNANPS